MNHKCHQNFVKVYFFFFTGASSMKTINFVTLNFIKAVCQNGIIEKWETMIKVEMEEFEATLWWFCHYKHVMGVCEEGICDNGYIFRHLISLNKSWIKGAVYVNHIARWTVRKVWPVEAVGTISFEESRVAADIACASLGQAIALEFVLIIANINLSSLTNLHHLLFLTECNIIKIQVLPNFHEKSQPFFVAIVWINLYLRI